MLTGDERQQRTGAIGRPEQDILDDAGTGIGIRPYFHALLLPVIGRVIRGKRPMFVIELVYKAGLPEIDAHMRAHVGFLKKYYAAGNFLVSGRKIPRDGGIILAVGKDRAEIERIIREDPFHEHDLADFRIIEFRASQRADDISERIANSGHPRRFG